MIQEHLRINLLGTLEVAHRPGPHAFGPPVGLTAAKLRQVLAMLAANADTTVSTEQLIDEMWPDGPPNTVKTAVQTYVYQIRKYLSTVFASPRGAQLLITRPGGYVLAMCREDVDLLRFRRLMEEGRDTLRRSRIAESTGLLREALGLWRGPVLADVPRGPSLQGISVHTEELRLEALSMRVEADLADHRHRELVSELYSLVSKHHLHETFHIQLMQALHRSGRRGDALSAYRHLHRILDDELGLEPSPEAKKLQHQILASR